MLRMHPLNFLQLRRLLNFIIECNWKMGDPTECWNIHGLRMSHISFVSYIFIKYNIKGCHSMMSIWVEAFKFGVCNIVNFFYQQMRLNELSFKLVVQIVLCEDLDKRKMHQIYYFQLLNSFPNAEKTVLLKWQSTNCVWHGY